MTNTSQKSSVSGAFRKADDEVVAALKDLDIALNNVLWIIVTSHKEFIIDGVISVIDNLKMFSAGVRIVSKSRKKADSIQALLSLISATSSPDLFVSILVESGVSRHIRERLFLRFLSSIKNRIPFTLMYGDPIPAYRKIIPLVSLITQLQRGIIETTLTFLSKTVLSQYEGWSSKRILASSLDYRDYEEDLQNSLFSITKSLGLFNTKMHKSFFSYTTRWIKYGIKASEFSIKEESRGNISWEAWESKYFEGLDEHISGSNEEEDLKQGYTLLLDLLRGSISLPIEIRVLEVLRQLTA